MSLPRDSPVTDFEDVPFRPFHVRTIIASGGGVFSDGFALGIVGIALSVAAPQLDLTPAWLGLIGGASLAGLFAGALVMGPVADRFGRRPIFGFNMLAIALLSAAQYFADSPEALVLLRLLIGIALGSDYVVSKALLSELSPTRWRGAILSTLAIAWAAGYVCAYVTGYSLRDAGDDSWRWMLLCSAIPAVAIMPFRLGTPESPVWLSNHGRDEESSFIVRKYLGANVRAPNLVGAVPPGKGDWRQLWSPEWRRHTVVGCVFYTCQVIPYFALGTFVPRVLAALNVESSHLGGLFYNLFLLAGAVFGLLIIDRISRRSFLVGSFAVTAAVLLLLCFPVGWSPIVVILLFAVFAGVLSAAANLEYIYVAELFPTQLRASGIGHAVAASRAGSATGTFLLPIIVAQFGVQAALGACVLVLTAGGLVCYLWAPETRNQPLSIHARVPLPS